MFKDLIIRKTHDITKPLFKMTITGEPCSKANSRQLIPNKKTGKHISIKSNDGRNYVKSFLAQVQKRRWTNGGGGLPIKPINCKLVMYCTSFYASERKDLDESLVMDCLEKSKIIRNDRLIREKHVHHFIDKFNPRSEIYLFARVI